MTDPLLLAMDVGTQSTRALAVDPRGHVVARAQVPHTPPLHAAEPGWAEQDPEVYWRALASAVTQLWAGGADPARVVALALTTQRGTVVASDEAGTPLRSAIVWPDQRLCTALPPLGLLWSAGFRLAGAHRLVRNLQRQAKANWLAQHEPALMARADRFTLLSGWLTRRLVGTWTDSAACQVGFVPFDYRRQQWARPGGWQWRALALRASQMPSLVPPAQSLGTLTADASRALGLPAGLPLIAAAADKACEVLGCGALDADVAHCSFGTAATINTTQRRYMEVERLLPAYPAALPGAYTTEIQIERGYWLVSWFRREFGDVEVARAEALGVAPEVLFDELIRAVPPGAQGLMLQPTWSPGLRHPGPEAKGAIIGFGSVHTRAHLYRAMIEGIAYGLRAGRERIERRLGTRLTRLVISGGGSQSDGAMQVTADVFNLVAERPAVHDASALGAAMLAAAGARVHADVPAAARAMARTGARFAPEPAHAQTYDRLYREVYRPLYARLAPLYHRIRRITGYPE
ncbi:MAG: FGGY-family carbohydrate kinase [Gemmatimonadetes bacterium]|nr:FGGY-family carbohydrate kinase [Gemmatimonadota bacterium]